MEERMINQRKAIKKHLESGKTITPLTALQEYGCFRLSAVIYVLKYDYGLDIETTMRYENGRRYAEYKLTTNNE